MVALTAINAASFQVPAAGEYRASTALSDAPQPGLPSGRRIKTLRLAVEALRSQNRQLRLRQAETCAASPKALNTILRMNLAQIQQERAQLQQCPMLQRLAVENADLWALLPPSAALRQLQQYPMLQTLPADEHWLSPPIAAFAPTSATSGGVAPTDDDQHSDVEILEDIKSEDGEGSEGSTADVGEQSSDDAEL